MTESFVQHGGEWVRVITADHPDRERRTCITAVYLIIPGILMTIVLFYVFKRLHAFQTPVEDKDFMKYFISKGRVFVWLGVGAFISTICMLRASQLAESKRAALHHTGTEDLTPIQC
ncbi:hypothetical protein HDE_03610 [Halotydeus destructor]|nr:hypothetical protein HDE_03610 [Halotydeus destructor]